MSGAVVSTNRSQAKAASTRPERSTRSNTKQKSRRSQGWMPNQHGAWFMLFIPPLMGLILQPSWAALPLLITWWAGYFTYFAITIWAKGRLRPKHLPPVLTYGAITALAGIAALITQWQLIAWLPIFAPIIAVAVYETIKRRERSLVSGWSTVLAAAMMLPTVASISTNGTPAAVSGDLWWATAWFALYFGGSIYYVKTLIRDFGNHARFIQSVGFHAAVFIGAIALAVAQPHTWPVAVVGALLAARSYAVPRIAQRRGKRIPPKYVGMIDGLVTVFVVVAAFAAFGS
ncbi:hypothetical protein AYJ05_12045 [Corynebacterium stationis]|uniref:YwiC-like family protein n=1 Tax=Corynebacterium stationis TaxID=1705 RepID=A0A177IPP4_9CORY|nr:YwiC-like family protein [Corynebacterium stationis]OAH30782.1 hypothetical protein AYJ05_12045 [Corynebacterium stationis]